MERIECDVAVVGSGIAGLSAALAAAEEGAKVVIVERARRGEHGGNTRYTEAFLRMKSIDAPADDFEDQLAASSGYHVDPSMAAETLRDENTWHPLTRSLNFTNPALIERFAQETGPTLRWLATYGLRFEPLPTPFLTTSTTRLAPVGGGLALVDTLTSVAEERGVRLEYETTAQSLLQDEGRIVGVLTRRRTGSVLAVETEALVLACGGFQGNSEMMARYVDRAAYVRPIARGGYYNRGEGIQMALDAGAAPAGNFNLFHAEPIDPRSGIPEPALFIFPYAVLINRDGLRFVDEAPGPVDAHYEAITRRILDQPDGIAYIVMDSKIDDVPNNHVAIRTDQPPITSDSIETLAAELDVPQHQFVETINAYNAACPASDGFNPLRTDNLATTQLHPPKSHWARPIDTPPFLAYPISCANVFSFGGLMVTTSAEVLSTDGMPIAGLYAAGEVIGLFHGTYVGSTSVLRGAVFGRIAGQHAAQASATENALLRT